MARDNFSKDSHVPSDKQQRYDRQLRLWASKGQDALESAHVVFVNSGSGVVAIEALKNMILPGIGRFTVIDDAVVDESDLGSNFFLSRSSIGSSRARLCADLLTELNTNVIGDWRPKEAVRYPSAQSPLPCNPMANTYIHI
jgi:amyloid beta precursor protein binding protein 1